ncbi:hypothetical protein AAHE18_14G079500 [Arachis hypogaea]
MQLILLTTTSDAPRLYYLSKTNIEETPTQLKFTITTTQKTMSNSVFKICIGNQRKHLPYLIIGETIRRCWAGELEEHQRKAQLQQEASDAPGIPACSCRVPGGAEARGGLRLQHGVAEAAEDREEGSAIFPVVWHV